jgi:hypothetical protein
MKITIRKKIKSKRKIKSRMSRQPSQECKDSVAN